MTRPAVIFFGSDERGVPKVFLRTLIICTAKRGRIIESLYVVVSPARGEPQYFNIWVYGETEKLFRGSGLFVGETGVEANHHFLQEPKGSNFKFTAGMYRINVYACLLGNTSKTLLFTQSIEVTGAHEAALEGDAGLYFDWYPERSQYVPHIDNRVRKQTVDTIGWTGTPNSFA